MADRFSVLIHAPLYAALRELPGDRRARFRRLIERLRAGRWDGGTRVKKLSGVAKPVFEARQDDKNRLLFTLATSAAPDGSDRLQTYLQVWDLVHHDRVTDRASRMNRSAEAEFLDYRLIEAEPITDPPPHPAAGWSDVPAAEAGREPGVLEIMLPPDDFRAPEREEVAGGVRWYLVPERLIAGDDDWQALVDGGAEELELKLTAEQYAVVRAPGPILLSGSAGSGKTTIAVHRLAAATTGPAAGRTLYLTYSPWLLDYARRLYRDLLLCRGDRVAAAVEFLTMEDLYRALIAGAGGTAPHRLADYPEFARWYHRAVGGREAALAWEEIRSIVKGACLDPRRAMLHRGEYEELGRKRAPLFQNRRAQLYPVAKRWQRHLEESRRLDEIDLCRLAFAAAGGGARRSRGAAGGAGPARYDHLICDEAQDLAEIQMELLLLLCRGTRFGGLFLAGDPQQVINPSGFRWAEVRTRLRERFRGAGRATPDLHRLTRNFRSVRGLVDLANEVLAFKRARIGRSEGDEAEESAVAGAAPVLVDGSEGELIAAAAGFGPRCAVIAGSAALRDHLQRTLDTTRVFLVQEIKGLEFDVVILWGLLAADPAPWHRLLDPQAELREDPACRRALHHLYVAVTRARRHLAVYEPSGAPPLWVSDRFRPRFDSGPPATLSRLFARSAPPEDWIREAGYYADRGRFRQAAECYRRGGDAARASECLARHHETAGEMRAAAERWLALGRAERAAECFEEAGRFTDAVRAWSRAGRQADAGRCRIRADEAAGRWREAAGQWAKREAWPEAARCWAAAGERRRQVECLARADEAAERFAEAAGRWEEINDLDRAAAAWRRAGRDEKALQAQAVRHETQRRWGEAAAVWERAGESRRARECRARHAESTRDFAAAATAWEELGDFAAAAAAWRRAGSPAEALRCRTEVDLAAGRFARAAARFEEAGRFDAAAAAWEKAAAAGQRPTRAVDLPLPEAARRPWAPGCPRARLIGRGRFEDRIDPSTRALICEVRFAEETGEWERAEEGWSRLRDRIQALRCRVTRLQSAGKPAAAAELLEKHGKLQAALDLWKRAGRAGRAAGCEARLWEKRRDYARAMPIWERLGDEVAVSRCRARLLFGQEEYAEAAKLFEAAGDSFMATECLLFEAQVAGDWRETERILRRIRDPERLRYLRRHRKEWRADGKFMAARRRNRLRLQKRETVAEGPSFRRARELAEWGRAASQGRLPLENLPAGEERRTPSRSTGPRKKQSPAALILESLDREGGTTCREMAEMTGLPAAAIRAVLAKLVRSGILEKTGRTRGTRYWLKGDVVAEE